MNVDVSHINNARIFIFEGIAGSGKDTIQNELIEYFNKNNFLVYAFSEEELLFSWKHFWIKNIDMLRIQYLHSLLDYCEELLEKNEKTVVILNRFHITCAITSRYNDKPKKLYDKLIDRLRYLPVHTFIGKLSLDNIERRASHSERKEEIWRIHQQKRIRWANARSLFELYKDEQETAFKIIEEQGIPYSIFELDR